MLYNSIYIPIYILNIERQETILTGRWENGSSRPITNDLGHSRAPTMRVLPVQRHKMHNKQFAPPPLPTINYIFNIHIATAYPYPALINSYINEEASLHRPVDIVKDIDHKHAKTLVRGLPPNNLMVLRLESCDPARIEWFRVVSVCVCVESMLRRGIHAVQFMCVGQCDATNWTFEFDFVCSRGTGREGGVLDVQVPGTSSGLSMVRRLR